MKTLFHHVEHLKTKPHATRRQIAMGTAFGVSGLVALVWLIGSVTTGSFNIQTHSFAEAVDGSNTLATSPTPQDDSLIGAAAAAITGDQGPARIEIVSTATSSTLTGKQVQAEQTVIPF